MRCNGIHCDGCHHHGGGVAGGAGAVVALLVIVAVALRRAWPQIVSAVEIAAWTVAGVTGTAIVVTGGVLTARTVRRRRAAALAARPMVTITQPRARARPVPGGHGTVGYDDEYLPGPAAGRKLTDAKARQIRDACEWGEATQREVAARFGVSASTVSDIATGKTWGWLT
jgi:hypothetical protein